MTSTSDPPAEVTAPVKNDSEEEDPYAVSSDSDSETAPPPMIKLGATVAVNKVKESLTIAHHADKTTVRATIDKELEEMLGADAMKNLKGNFEGQKAAVKKERQKLTDIDTEKYSQFKDKFENLPDELQKNDEKRAKKLTQDVQSGDKEELSKNKDLFEALNSGVYQPDPKKGVPNDMIQIQRSKHAKNRVFKNFIDKKSTDNDSNLPPACVVCDKIVYKVDQLRYNRHAYHQNCFKCTKCAKVLTLTTFNTSDNRAEILCKVHKLALTNLDEAAKLDPMTTIEDQHRAPSTDNSDDDEPYAFVSKPKDSEEGVVKSGAIRTSDDLTSLPSLNAAKAALAAQPDDGVVTRAPIEIGKGAVKERMSRIIDGGAIDRSDDEDDDVEGADPNMIRARKHKREELHFDKTAALKTKWAQGDIEKAAAEKADRTAELEQLRSVKLADRFKERTGDEVTDEQSEPLTNDHVDTTLSSEAMKRFHEGTAWQDSEVKRISQPDIERCGEMGSFKQRFEHIGEEKTDFKRTEVDGRCAELGNIKSAFEDGKFDREDKHSARALKINRQRSIADEFASYGRQRRAADVREQRVSVDVMAVVGDVDDGEVEITDTPIAREIVGCAGGLGSIKDKFDNGTAFNESEIMRTISDYKEIQQGGGAARQVFEQRASVDESGQAKAPPAMIKMDGVDVKEVNDLVARFKMIEENQGKVERSTRTITPPPEGYRSEFESSAIARDPNVLSYTGASHRDEIGAGDTKNLLARFEAANDGEGAMSEATKARLADEFAIFKALKEQQGAEATGDSVEGAQQLTGLRDEELAVIAKAHANKMAQKWEKINTKEAKKAAKSMPVAGGKRAPPIVTPKCFVCTKSVYIAERVECDGRPIHPQCFKCVECCVRLRPETYAIGNDDRIYCQTHHKQHFNNMAQSGFNACHSYTSPIAC